MDISVFAFANMRVNDWTLLRTHLTCLGYIYGIGYPTPLPEPVYFFSTAGTECILSH